MSEIEESPERKRERSPPSPDKKKLRGRVVEGGDMEEVVRRAIAQAIAPLAQSMDAVSRELADQRGLIQQMVAQGVKEATAPMMELLNATRTIVDRHGKRLDGMEKKMAEMGQELQRSVEAAGLAEKKAEKMQWKIDDLDDRGRRENLRIINLPTGIEGSDAIGFLVRNLPKWFPSLKDHSHPLDIHRAHRVMAKNTDKPQPLIFKLLRYGTRQAILNAARKDPVRLDGAKIQFYPDYGTATVQKRASFKEVRAELWRRGVEQWLVYPAVLKISDKGQKHSFKTVKEAEDYLAAGPSGSTSPSTRRRKKGFSDAPAGFAEEME